MTVYTTDFSEYTTGVNLSDWTDHSAAGNFTYQAVANTGTYKVGSKCCSVVKTSSSAYLTWDTVGSVSDVDIIAKIDATTISTDGFRLISRMSASPSVYGYFLLVRSGHIDLYDNNSGGFDLITQCGFTSENSSNYYVRFQVIGTTLKAKVWNERAVEPNDWLLSATNSTHSSGYVGFGDHSSSGDIKCDYFSCGTGTDDPVFPPSTINSPVDKFGHVGAAYSSSASANLCRMMGGQFINSGYYLTGISFYSLGTAVTVRAAVYSGGTVDDPDGATLLHDFGELSVTGSPFVASCDPVAIPTNTPIWIILKYASFGLTYTTNMGNAGNFQIARGRCDITSDEGYDTTESFPTTLSASSGTFSDYWYPWDILISKQETTQQSIVFIMT